MVRYLDSQPIISYRSGFLVGWKVAAGHPALPKPVSLPVRDTRGSFDIEPGRVRWKSGVPLAASIDTFKELLVEPVLQDVTIQDLTSSKERLSQAQDIFEVYVTALATQLNVLRKQKLRTEETVRFIGAQLVCMPDVSVTFAAPHTCIPIGHRKTRKCVCRWRKPCRFLLFCLLLF